MLLSLHARPAWMLRAMFPIAMPKMFPASRRWSTASRKRITPWSNLIHSAQASSCDEAS
jgi:hypothetical protein